MVSVIINWSYILVTSFIIGSFVLNKIRTITRNKVNTDIKTINAGSCIVCGICVLTAYAGYFSLITGVGLAANILLVTACILIIVFERSTVRNILCNPLMPAKDEHEKNTGERKVRLRVSVMVHTVLAVLIIIVCAYFTSCGRFAYDTGTYHAQSIHWIESFGVVKGLAHMQTRLGFNSSYFCLCALYSMHFLGRSMHTVSGFLAAFVMLYALNGWFGHFVKSEGSGIMNKGLRVSDFLYPAPFIYFIITAVEIISPSTDHGVIWLIIWLCIRWVEMIEEEAENGTAYKGMEGYALLCVMAVFLVSVKLSVGVLALLVIKPAVALIREKKIRAIAAYIIMGLILILPYFVRNIIISGWLVYPMPSVDLFSVDWKVPAEGARHEADEIVVWARYTKDTALIDQKINEWFPVWWSEQGAANRYLSKTSFAGAAIMAGIIVTGGVYGLWLRLTSKKAGQVYETEGMSLYWNYVYFGAILLVSYGFFMLSAPSNRFGYGYILLLPLFSAGVITFLFADLIKRNIKVIHKWCIGLAMLIFVCFDMLKGIYMFASDDAHYFLDTGIEGALIVQKDYPQARSVRREWEGITIYYPETDGEQIWYHDFPAILYGSNLDGIERRGNKIRDGFRLKQSD
jgi:hypothetical protein